MSARLLVLDAGSAAGNNLIRSLKAGDPSLVIVGCNDSRFILKKSAADRNCLLPVSSQDNPAALRRIVKSERIDLIFPTNDTDVLAVAELRNKLACRTFLPRTSVIERCQDKYALTTFLRRRGIPAPLTYAITDTAKIEALFRRFNRRTQLWCRNRSGSGSYGAIPVKSPDQARSWIAYWEQMRAVPPGSFTLSEYLPGRDFCVQCLWDKGTLVLAKTAERITYLHTGSPSGVSSTPALAKTAHEPRIVKVCEKAIRALDAKASGVFFVDIKESDDGRPCITEINAGRFATITNIHDLVGRHNMAVTFVRLALGERIRIPKASDFAEGYYLVRSVDTLPAVIRKHELFEGIEDGKLEGDGGAVDRVAAGMSTEDSFEGRSVMSSKSFLRALLLTGLAACPSLAMADTLRIKGIADGDSVVILMHARTKPGDGGCKLLEAARSTGELSVDNLLSGCTPWLAVLSKSNAMLLESPAWTDDAEDTRTVTLKPIIKVPVTVWIANPASADEAVDHMAHANLLFEQNKVGVEFVPKFRDVPARALDAVNKGFFVVERGPEVGQYKCRDIPRIQRSGAYVQGMLNVYYIREVITGRNCAITPPKGDANITYIGTGSNRATLAHEFGHAFGLRPGDDGGHTGGDDGFPSNNIMVEKGTAFRKHFSAGQVFRMNTYDDPRHGTMLIKNGRRSHTGLKCAPLTTSPQCPALDTDWRRP